MIKVFHNAKFMDYYLNKDALKNTSTVLAATVKTNDLEEAFRLTNHINNDWQENEGVTSSGLSRRSTSVGDILVEDSKYHVVESCGFRELSAEEVSSISFQTEV